MFPILLNLSFLLYRTSLLQFKIKHYIDTNNCL